MTILEENPLAILARVFDQIQSFLSLTLAKRNGVKRITEALISAKLVKHLCWVSTCRQNEDKWREFVCILIDAFHSCVLAFDIVLAKVSPDVILEGKHELLWSEDFQNNAFLEIC